MKIKRYNRENTGGLRSGKPTLSIHRIGIITISKQLAEDLKIKEGSFVELLQDEDRPTDWYLIINSSDNGFEVRRKKATTYTLVFNSKHVVREMLKSVALEKSARFLVSISETELEPDLYAYAIITKSAS